MQISIDPGVRHAGVAYWQGVTLVDALLFRHKEGYLPLARMIEEYTETYWGDMTKIVIEKPQAYHEKAKQKGDQNDLIELSIVVGLIVAGLAWGMSPEVVYYLPREWKKQMKKEITTPRILAALSPEERAAIQLPKAKGLQHNVYDGIGIGLNHIRKARNPTCGLRFVPKIS